MLELIRKYSKSIVVKVFLTVLAASFLFFFAFPIIADKLMGKDYVVKIANMKISPQVFKYERDKKINAIKKRLGNVDAKDLSSKILHQIIWENVVDLAAKDFGIVVSDSTMYSHISNMSEFRTSDGHFSAANLRKFLRMFEVSESEFLNFSKKEIKSHIIRFPFRYISLADEFKCYSKIKTEKRRLKFVKINPSSFRVSKIPTNEELEAFYNDNSEKFEIPERRSFEILILSMDRVSKNTKIPQEEVIEKAREFYGEDYVEKSPEEFMKTEEFRNFKQERDSEAAEEIIRQVQDDLVSGSTIEKVIKKYGLRSLSIKNVAFNEYDKVALPFKKDVMTVAFGANEKEVGDFNEAQDSNKKLVQWLVYVSDIKPKHVEPFELAKERVKLLWHKDQQHSKALSVANEMVSKVANGESFVNVFRKAGYDVKSTAYFDREGFISGQKSKSEIISGFYEEAFGKVKNEVGLKEMNGSIVVYQLDGITYDSKSEKEHKQSHYVELVRDNSEDMYQQLIGHLSKKYEVKINYDVLKKVDESIDDSALDDVF